MGKKNNFSKTKSNNNSVKRKCNGTNFEFNKRLKFFNKNNKTEISKPVKKLESHRTFDSDISSKNNIHDETDSEEESPFNQLINSFNENKKNEIGLSSSDSESEVDDVKQSSIKHDGNESDSSKSEVFNEGETLLDEDYNDKDMCEDPFEIHFQHDLSDKFYEIVSTHSKDNLEEYIFEFPTLGKLVFNRHKNNDCLATGNTNSVLSGEKEKKFAIPGSVPSVIKHVDWDSLFIKTQIRDNIFKANVVHSNLTIDPEKLLTSLQKELFSIINHYQDLYYPYRTLDNGEEIRFLYCLHAVNHALKTRLKVIHHNARLTDKNDVPDDFRDQGLVRPKVLIVVPFRNSAFRIVQMIISILLSDEKPNVINKKRFLDEFTGGEIIMPRKKPKPIDYERTFSGNTDDNFKIGLSVTKKSLKLYADFYSSDIIVASPLGLRMIVGAEGEAERDFDFLASVEVLVLDQTEIFLMQNWDHLLHVMDHFHLQPKQGHGTDFSRVRNWALNGWTQYYRQTLIFSSLPLPLITALFIKKCNNYAGKVTVSNPVGFGSICQVAVKIPQVFCRVDCSSSVESVDKRLNYFIKEILPQMRDPFMNHTCIYVPSYLDYVMIRNYFRKETISFVQICEYSKDGKIARARDKFFHGESHFLLYSERFHFFRRIQVKGIRHIVFYQPPTFPNFYSELCNMMQEDKDVIGSVTTLYTKFDLPQLSAIVGSERMNRLLHSSNPIHRILTK